MDQRWNNIYFVNSREGYDAAQREGLDYYKAVGGFEVIYTNSDSVLDGMACPRIQLNEFQHHAYDDIADGPGFIEDYQTDESIAKHSLKDIDTDFPWRTKAKERFSITAKRIYMELPTDMHIGETKIDRYHHLIADDDFFQKHNLKFKQPILFFLAYIIINAGGALQRVRPNTIANMKLYLPKAQSYLHKVNEFSQRDGSQVGYTLTDLIPYIMKYEPFLV
jgi:hypothetical protein